MPLDVYKDWLGIPEGPRPPDHYQLLRLKQFEDDPSKIQKNYKKLNEHVRKYASGQYQQESQDLLNELARAMLCLTDPERKRDYDESLGREFEESAASRRPKADGPRADGAGRSSPRSKPRKPRSSRKPAGSRCGMPWCSSSSPIGKPRPRPMPRSWAGPMSIWPRWFPTIRCSTKSRGAR